MESITIEPEMNENECFTGKKFEVNTVNESIVNTVNNSSNKNETWKSCCLTMDKGAIKYFSQIFILGGLILFSATMLVIDKDCNSQRNYSSLLMICLGVFLPNPKLV
jgi:hypothetical protein